MPTTEEIGRQIEQARAAIRETWPFRHCAPEARRYILTSVRLLKFARDHMAQRLN